MGGKKTPRPLKAKHVVMGRRKPDAKERIDLLISVWGEELGMCPPLQCITDAGWDRRDEPNKSQTQRQTTIYAGSHASSPSPCLLHIRLAALLLAPSGEDWV
ncbi:unnamed protein product [Ectocarpus sp. 12 AP-2014]